MTSKRSFPTLERCLLIVLMITALALASASAEGLFPSMTQMFGTAMPSIGVVLGRVTDEFNENAEGMQEIYHAFSYDDYAAFGAYLKAVGAELESTETTESTITVKLSVRGSSMQFIYDWSNQTATAIYPSGTRPETERESVKSAVSILPHVGGIMPSAQFAVSRKPDSESAGNTGITQVWESFTDADYNAFSAYLAETGAILKQSSVESGILTAEISLNGGSFTFTYDWRTKTASVFYPDGTSPERAKGNVVDGTGSILPNIDTIGKDLPRISQALSRVPDSTETLSDGSLQETYNSFDEADYTSFSQYLQTAGCQVVDYHVEDGGVMVIQLSNLSGNFTFTYDSLGHTSTVVYPKDSQIEMGWVAPTERPTPAATATPKPDYSQAECWNVAHNYFKNLSWKNPSSVTIHSNSATYNASDRTYTFYINYSAQNGFGGYNRSYYYITVSAKTGQVTFAYGGN